MDAPIFPEGAALPRPFRDCFDAFARLLPRKRLQSLVCLDIGMPSAGVSRALRETGGFWRTVSRSPAEAVETAKELSDPKTTCLNADGSIPFPPHSFDCVLVGPGMLAAVPDREAFVKECNRVLKPSGLLLVSARMRRPLSPATALLRRAAPGDPRTAAFSETEFYGLLKTGFDVAESNWCGKFWSQIVYAKGLKDVCRGAAPEETARRLSRAFAVAAALDRAALLSRGHVAVFAARRRQWRERAAPSPRDGRSLGEAVLFNPPA